MCIAGYSIKFSFNEKQITDKKEIAEKLNNFFINIGPKLANELDPVGKPDFKSYLNVNKVKTVFKFTPIEEEETKTIIKNLKPKNSSGHDSISLILLNPLDPIEISENPSEILGKSPFLTKYGSICFFHNNLFNIEYLSLQVKYILISIELPTPWYRTCPYILHTFY